MNKNEDRGSANGVRGVSRRSFLGGCASIGALGLMGVAAGCASQSAKPQESGSSAAAKEPTTWRDAPEAPADSDISETVDVDVLVIGGGSSGLGSARSALLHGASSVLVLEKNETSRIGGGVHGVLGSTYASEKGIEFGKEQIDEMIKDEMKASCMRADERYYRVWASRSAETFKSMSEAFDTRYVHLVNDGAAPYDQMKDEYFSESVYPGEGLQISSGDVNTPIIEGFTEWVTSNGGDIRYKCQGEQLIKEGGKVVGAYAVKDDGTYLKVNAKAVIVSTGGFEGNDEMMADLAPHAYGVPIANTVAGTGDGIKMIVWAGGQTQLSPCCTMMSSATSPENPNIPSPIPFIVVNKNGERFVNEATSSFLIPYAILNQPERKAWQIFDKNYAEAMNNLKIQTWMGTIYFNEEKCAQFESVASKADSIEGLASAMGIDPEGLKSTLDNYSQMTASGHDDQFGVPPRFMQAVNPVEPPFYGMEVPYYVDVTCGGIICDPETSEVLDEKRNAIPGLYATGNTVGERFGACYTNNMTGLSNGFADVAAFIAGESVGKYLKQV